MSAIRDEIRAILREELSALLAEHSGPRVETVRIETSDDLNAFARRLAEQMSVPGFASKLQSGEVRFALERSAQAAQPRAIPAAPTLVGRRAETESAHAGQEAHHGGGSRGFRTGAIACSAAGTRDAAGQGRGAAQGHSDREG